MFSPHPAKHLASTRVVAGMVLLLSLAQSAQAQFNSIAFTLNIAEKELVLENPNDMAMIKYAAWDTSMQRILDRNMPFLELTNSANSDAPITQFSMTIGDPLYQFSDAYFGTYATLGDSTPGVAINSSVADNGDLLIVDFLNGGLLPGETVRFRIDIDPDAGHPELFPHPDFRLVLFDMNDDSMDDNAEVTVTFGEMGMTQDLVGTLEDYDVSGPQAQIFNQFRRPNKLMEGVDVFTLSVIIPEPGSAVLTSLACLGMLALAAGRRTARSR